MCGIVGIVSSQPTHISERLLEDMALEIRHRGPDSSGVWMSDNNKVGLAHRRLSIVDLSDAGRQPMANYDGSIQITFNGEIYNFKNLRRDLENKGYKFKSDTDTEVILYLYQEHGEAMIDMLDGDFGLGIWDAKKQKLILSRDRAGVKPVYYTILNNTLIFASEIKAILKHPIVEKGINNEALYHYLTYLVVPAPNTLFDKIYKLPNAGILTAELNGDDLIIKNRKYWEPFPGRIDVNFKNLDEQFEELFDRSVKKRLMSDVPVGVLFSGGVDSSLNTSVFRKYHEGNVRTYNVGMEGTKMFNDESDHAFKMAKKIGSDHFQIKISEEDLLNTSKELIHFQDEPISDPVSVPLYFITKHAKETGTTVLQAGEGADEIFCGYDNYRRFLTQYDKLWSKLSVFPKSIGNFAGNIVSLSSNPKTGKIKDVLYRYAKGQEFFMSSAVAYYESEKQSIISSEFSNYKYDSFNIVEPYYERIRNFYPDASFLQIITYIEMQLRLPELLLMRVDKMSMANAVEVRVPFLDRDLIDFALSVPENFKLRDNISKEPVKRYASKYIGKDEIYKPKKGFGAPIQEWFNGILGEDLLEQIEGQSQELAEFFNINVIKKRIQAGPSTVNQAFQLWVLYNFVKWREYYIA